MTSPPTGTARPQLGILGFGAFARFMAAHLTPHFELSTWDRRPLQRQAARLGVGWSSIEQLAGLQTVVLAIPVNAFENVLRELRPHLGEHTRVLDVASVKSRSLELLASHLPEQVPILGLHPMFGPQSGRHGIVGMRVALCRPDAPRRAAMPRSVRRFLEDRLGLEVLEMTAQHHDRQIAYIQGLTHWIARALREIELPDTALATPAYRHMLEIEAILREDSDELFLTIQRENPFAAEARARLRRRLAELEGWIQDGS